MSRDKEILSIIVILLLLKFISCQWTKNDNEIIPDRNNGYCKYCELAEKNINRGEWTCNKCVYVVDKYKVGNQLFIDVVTNYKITKLEAWKRKYYNLDHLCYVNFVLRMEATEDNIKFYDNTSIGNRIHIKKEINYKDETLYYIDVDSSEIY